MPSLPPPPPLAPTRGRWETAVGPLVAAHDGRLWRAHSDAVNGALWTLKIEVMFYVAVPIIVYLFRRLGHLPVIAALYALSLGYATLMAWQAQRTGAGIYLELGRQLPGQLSYFMAGAFLYYFLPLFERRVAYFVGVAAAHLHLIQNLQGDLP